MTRNPLPPLRSVDLFGQHIAYREAGPADGPVVLLVHGLGSTSAEWGPALDMLATRARVIAPDLPGHGRSFSGRGDYSLGAFANVLRDLLDALGVDQVMVVGHSMGGGVSMMFAYQYPHRVERLVLVSSGGLGPELTPLLRAATIPGGALGLRVLGGRATAAVMGAAMPVSRLRPGADPVGTEQLQHGFRAFRRADTRRAFRATASSIIDARGQRVDATGRLPLTRGKPLLLVHGDADRFIPLRHSENAHASVPGSELVIFAGAGHYPHLNEPRRFADLVLAHLDAVPQD